MMTVDHKKGVTWTGSLIALYEDLLEIRNAALTNDEVNAAWVMTMGSIDEKQIKEKYRKALKA